MNKRIIMMHKTIILLFLAVGYWCLTGSAPAYAQDVSGSWAGQLSVGTNKIDLIFHISKADGEFQTLMDIPAQGVIDARASLTVVEGNHLQVTFSQFNIQYEGSLNEAGIIEGEYRQSGIKIPFTLTREIPMVHRPQAPTPPYPYFTEEIAFNSADGTKLAGTLSLPQAEPLTALVIIVSGSGPQDRDGHLFGHKPYLVLGDHLTRAGIGVFRFDERGVGASGGDFATADLKTQIQDVQAAFAFIKSRSDVQGAKLGLVGHSIGGLIVPQIALADASVDFLVLLAAPGLPGDELMLAQKADYERKLGVPEFQIAQGKELIKGAYDVITQTNLEGNALKDSINSFYLTQYGAMLPEDQRKLVVEQLSSSPELIDLIRSRPAEHLEKVRVPVLALNGDKDFQVLSAENLPAISEALRKGGNVQVQVHELKDLNHLFQESETGLLDEYARIEQSFSPIALDIITQWIQALPE